MLISGISVAKNDPLASAWLLEPSSEVTVVINESPGTNPCALANVISKVASAEYEIADQLAAEIDRQILSNYKLFPTNILAWQMQGDKDSAALAALKQRWPREDWLETEVRFKSHLAAIPSMHRQIVIDAYATPVDNQLSLQNKS